jgi:hypothetical protein
MRPTSPFRNIPARLDHRVRPAAVLAIACLAVACSGSEGGRERAAGRSRDRAAAGCGSVDTTVVTRDAVLALIASTNPPPLRFLYIPGTDSSLPEGGVRALQDKGPTYLYSQDPKLQEQAKANLANRGPWNALLVLYEGMTRPSDDTVAVKLSGRFVGSVEDGQVVPSQTLRFACATAGDSAHRWRLTNPPARASAAAGTATP